MSTRYAPDGAPVSFERYMSSPEYSELRGIPGTAVGAKAQLYSDARKRSLLFFLQSLSLKEGGLRGIAGTLLERFPTYCEEELTDLLVEICINPKVLIRFSGEPSPSRPCFSLLKIEMADALRESQERYEAKVRSEFVLTTIGKEVFETLDHALAIGKMVVIEGESGSGKTTAAKAWCAQHQGQARFVSLSGITHKTGFFRQLATAIGLSASRRKASDMQVKVEEFFRKTQLMLVIDEAHYLFPRLQQRESSPVLIDWINTALVNHNVPVALICTDQFAKLKARVEKRTGWTSEQLEHRVKRYKRLLRTPTKQDLEAVAAKLLGMRWNMSQQRWNMTGAAPHPDFVRMVVGYALTCKMRLPAVAGTIEEARYQARKIGRPHVVATDIRTALLDYQIPSDQALQNAIQSDEASLRLAVTVQSSTDPILQRRCNGIATAAQ
ncbi:MAG TPA: AAA family ATPase [Candidatus Udaeobacter sp.]|nr:AAA family ATPase [Candidatus Udaeobacter sp.]